MVDKSVLETAKKEIAALDKEMATLARKREAWEVIIENYQEAPPSPQQEIFILRYPVTIREAVNRVLVTLGNQEVSARMIEEQILESDMMPDVKHPRVRISMILNELTKKGLAEKTFGPKTGTEPHRFLINPDYLAKLRAKM